MSLIKVNNLKVYFHTDRGIVRAVDGVDFSIEKEKTLGVVGESGCGKSMTARAILKLIQMPPGRIETGEIRYHRNGEIIDLAKLSPKGKDMRSIRGKEIAMIFQEPMTSLNPLYTIGNQIMETISLHERLPRKESRQKAIEMLQAVGIPSPEHRINEYPHQLSGGMRQRAMIAMALSCNPSLLIADEPTTALDVTIQAQVMDLMNQLREDFRTAIMFITHDLGLIASIADDVMVMYLGKIIESAPVRAVFNSPRHPYTQGLIKSIPLLTSARKKRLIPIKGSVPDLLKSPTGCRFESRCGQSMELCKMHIPSLTEVAPGHKVACWLYDET
jgi:oligopeptide/dipeptide ABC transporter ATP-binding protein